MCGVCVIMLLKMVVNEVLVVLCLVLMWMKFMGMVVFEGLNRY